MLTLLLPAPLQAAVVTETWTDKFSAVGYLGNDGSQNWTGGWTELGESDGATLGRAQVVADARCAGGNCLRIGANDATITGKGVVREADLSGADSASLRFSYQRRNLDGGGGSITVAVSGNGGVSWTDLATYSLSTSDPGQVLQTFDISGHIDTNTQIRFLGSGSDIEAYFYADDIEISAQFDVNTPPTLDELNDRSDAEGASVLVDAHASDPDPDTLSYSATGLPPGLTINPDSGLISGAISYSAAASSPYNVIVKADDGNGGSDTESFTWSVINTNQSPHLSLIPDRVGAELTPISFTASATDPDLDGLEFSLMGAPAGATINPLTGAFLWIPGEVHGPGTYTFTVKVSDNGSPVLTDSQSVKVSVTEVNRPPNLTDPGDQNSGEGTSVFLPLIVSDADLPANPLVFNATGLPPGLAINSSTGLISGTISPLAADASPYLVKVTVDDDAGASDSETFTWNVTAVATSNLPPTVVSVPPRIVEELTKTTIAISASDPDGDSLTYSLVGAPAGLSINATTGTITWLPSEAQGPGTYAFSVKVTDDGQPIQSSGTEITIEVLEANSEPALENPGDQYSLLGETVSLHQVVTDADLPSQELRYEAVGLPTGLSINADTGLISGTIDAAAITSEPYRVEMTVIDDGSPSASTQVEFLWTVTTETQPVAHSATYVTSPDTPVSISLTGSHPTDQPISYELVETPQRGRLTGSPPNLVYTPNPGAVGQDSFTFVVSDGTTASPVATVTVDVRRPNTPPVAQPDTYLTDPGVTLVVEAPGVVANDTDSEAKALTVSLLSAPANGTLRLEPDGSFEYKPDPGFAGIDTFTYQVSDDRGGTAEAVARIIVSASVKTPIVADIISLDGDSITGSAGPVYERAFTRVSQAATTSLATMSFPLIFLGLFGGAMLTLGRVALIPAFTRGDPETGVVKVYDEDGHYGLIQSEHSDDYVFFHRAAIRPRRQRSLTQGDEVVYRSVVDSDREVATRVRLADKTGRSTNPR